MKISAVRNLLIMADLLLLAGVGLVVYKGWKDKSEVQTRQNDFKARINGILEETKPHLSTTKATEGYKSLGLTLSGKKPPPPPLPPGPAAPTASAVDLSSLIHVHSIISRTGSEGAGAVVFLKPATVPAKGQEPEIEVFQENEVVSFVPEATVQRIEPDSVLFVYNGKEVRLSVDPHVVKGTGDARPKVSAPAGPIPQDPKVWISMPKGTGRIDISEGGMRALQSKGEDVLQGVRWSTQTLPDGKPAVQISHIPANNVLTEGGAQTGDIIESINNVRVTSKADIVRYVESNPDHSLYVVRFFRQGRLITKTVRPPKR